MAERLYRIGDAAKLLGLKTYVLRYWETEFPGLCPVRTGKGQRRYTEADMVLLTRVRYLLHDQGMTIEGVRKVLAGESELRFVEQPSVAADAKGATAVPASTQAEPVLSESVAERYPPASENVSATNGPENASALSTPAQNFGETTKPSAYGNAPSNTLGEGLGAGEKLVQLAMDFVVLPQMNARPSTATPFARAPETVTPQRPPYVAQAVEVIDAVADEARLKRITDELRALQTLLRKP